MEKSNNIQIINCDDFSIIINVENLTGSYKDMYLEKWILSNHHENMWEWSCYLE